MASKTDPQKQRESEFRVSQIIVTPVLINEHDAPVTPEPIVFTGNENGTAAENLSAWLADLPLHLQLASAQLANPPEEPVAS